MRELYIAENNVAFFRARCIYALAPSGKTWFLL